MVSGKLSLDILGILSLIIGFLVLFFSENKTLSLWVLFIVIMMIFGYNYYKENKSKFDSKSKNVKTKYLLLIFHMIIAILIITYLFFIFLSVIFFPEKFMPTAITLLFLALLLKVSFSKELEFSNKPLKYPKEFFYSIVAIFLLFSFLWGLSFYVDLRHFTILSYLIHTWPAFVILLGLTASQFFVVWEYNKLPSTIKTQNTKFNWKSFLKFTFFILFLVGIMLFLIVLPQRHTPEISYIDDCHSKYTYEITSKNKVLNSYMYSLQIKDFSKINIILSGILEKDGEYQEINVIEMENSKVKYPDKKYLQYFRTYPIYEPSLDLLILRFYIKRIEFFDSLKIVGIKNTC